MVAVEKEFDIVVTTNSGYPLDLNLYQTVKGMSAAARIVKKGGVIIAVSDCWDGIPAHGNFGKLLLDYPDPEVMLREITSPGFACLDQWQAQILAQIRLKADIYLYSDHLSEEQLSKVGIVKCTDIHQFIETQLRMKGKDASVCVLPEGPQTIPYMAK
jgi:nickel-dependent lactate racemase